MGFHKGTKNTNIQTQVQNLDIYFCHSIEGPHGTWSFREWCVLSTIWHKQKYQFQNDIVSWYGNCKSQSRVWNAFHYITRRCANKTLHNTPSRCHTTRRLPNTVIPLRCHNFDGQTWVVWQRDAKWCEIMLARRQVVWSCVSATASRLKLCYRDDKLCEVALPQRLILRSCVSATVHCSNLWQSGGLIVFHNALLSFCRWPYPETLAWLCTAYQFF